LDLSASVVQELFTAQCAGSQRKTAYFLLIDPNVYFFSAFFAFSAVKKWG